MVMYKGKWRYHHVCNCCHEDKTMSTKYGEVCEDCKKKNKKVGKVRRDAVHTYKKENNIPKVVPLTFKKIMEEMEIRNG